MPANQLTQRRRQTDSSLLDSIKSVPRRKKNKNGSAFYTTFEQAPLHLRDNKFILRGYRAGHDFKAALISALRLHNETGNIWSHLVGFIIFVLLTAAIYYRPPHPLALGREYVSILEDKWSQFGSDNLYDVVKRAGAFSDHHLPGVEYILRSIGRHNITEIGQAFSNVKEKLAEYKASGVEELIHAEEVLSNFSQQAFHDAEMAVYRTLASMVDVTWPVHRWPMYVFTSGAMICLLTSSVCHLFGCCSAHIAMIMWQFDYAGIAVLIVASFYPPVYYGFLCRPIYAVLYLSLITVLGIGTIAITLLPKFQDPSYHAWRAGVFTSLGLFGIFPLVHGWRIHSSIPEVHHALVLDIIMGIIYLIGAAFYTFKIPERWRPGAFDVAFHSHQLFHVAVVVAAMVHYKACSLMIQWRDATGSCLATNTTTF